MRVVASRTRAGANNGVFTCRLFEPLRELSPESQRHISYRTHFGATA